MAESPDEQSADARGRGARDTDELRSLDDVTEPAKLLRVIGLTRQVFEELQQGDQELDEAARTQVQTARQSSLADLREMLPEASRNELDQLVGPLEDGHGTEGEPPSGTHLRLADAQLLGWLEGLLKGLQAHQAFAQVGTEVKQAGRMREANSSPPSDARDGSPGYF